MLNPERAAWRVSMIILLISLNTIPLPAQTDRRYTYFGAGMTLATTTTMGDPNIFHFSGPSALDGGGYDVLIRREINKYLSIESGLNVFSFWMGFGYLDEEIEEHGLFSHNVPLKAELEVDLLKDRMALYATFGLQFNYITDSSFGWKILYMDHGELEIHKYYLPKTRVYSRNVVGCGARFRIVDQLIFELELGYGFRTHDLLEYQFTYRDDSGSSTDFSMKEATDYWYISYGISYPIERVMDGYRKLKESMDIYN